jgi:hypothetical protein
MQLSDSYEGLLHTSYSQNSICLQYDLLAGDERPLKSNGVNPMGQRGESGLCLF